MTVAEMNIDELRQLIRETVREALHELMNDPDAGLELRDEIVALLRRQRAEMEAGALKTISLEDVMAELAEADVDR
jgi:hypothetical protein